MHETHSSIDDLSTTGKAPSTPAPKPEPERRWKFRLCRACGEEWPLAHFYRQAGKPGSRRQTCKKCCRRVANKNRPRVTERPDRLRFCRGCQERLPIAHFPRDQRCKAGFSFTCATCQAERATGDALEELNLPDSQIAPHSLLQELRIDLGLAIAEATCPPGHCRTLEELAAFTNLTPEAIRQIEQRALEKMRRRAEELLSTTEIEKLRKFAF